MVLVKLILELLMYSLLVSNYIYHCGRPIEFCSGQFAFYAWKPQYLNGIAFVFQFGRMGQSFQTRR